MSGWAIDLVKFEGDKALWQSAIRRVPAIVLCLVLGWALHQPSAGLLGAGACLSVGMAALRQIRGSRLLSMVWTIGAMSFSAFLGTVVGGSPWAGPLVVALEAFLFALLTIYDDNVGWVAMQGTIALVVATAFPGQPLAALERGVTVAAGGTIQAVLLLAIWGIWGMSRLGEEKEGDGKPGPLHGYGYHWAAFVRSFSSASLGFQYAFRVAVTMLLASEAARHLPIKNGYWLPMTTLIVLKPDFYRTYSGGVQRVAGTIVGVGIASVIAEVFHPAAAWLVMWVAVFAFFSFALLKVNASVFAAALNAYVVFLIATAGIPETSVTGHRMVNTALGCGLALASRFIGYRNLLRLVGAEMEKARDNPVAEVKSG